MNVLDPLKGNGIEITKLIARSMKRKLLVCASFRRSRSRVHSASWQLAPRLAANSMPLP